MLDGLARTLLEVGRRQFVELGFHRASVVRIAEEAGTSVGLLYYHFGSKEGQYRALWTDYQEQQYQNARQAIKLVRSAGVTDNRTLFLAGTRAYMSNCWVYRDIVLMALVGDLPPGFNLQSRAVSRSWVEQNAELLGLGSGPQSGVLVEMTGQAIGGAATIVAGAPTREAAEEIVDAAMAVLQRMLPPPSA